MENPFDEYCEQFQLTMLNLFAKALTSFGHALFEAIKVLSYNADHQAGDNGEYLRHHAADAAHAYIKQSKALSSLLLDNDDEMLRKATYYKALFHIQENLLPAVVMVEKTFGDKAPNADGAMFSSAVRGFLSMVD